MACGRKKGGAERSNAAAVAERQGEEEKEEEEEDADKVTLIKTSEGRQSRAASQPSGC